MKQPHKKERAWLEGAKRAIETKFKVKFPDNKKKFLYKIADYLFNNTFNQRMRRGMLQNVGGVWYERIYPKKGDVNRNEVSFTTLFNGPVVFEKKTVVVMGFSYLENVVRRAGVIPRYLPTKDKLSKDIQFLPQDLFIAKMQEYYRRYHIETEVVGTEVRT